MLKTGALRACGSSQDGHQIHNGVNSVFPEKLMPTLSLGGQARGERVFIKVGYGRLEGMLELCGWDVRHEGWGDGLVTAGTGETGTIRL